MTELPVTCPCRHEDCPYRERELRHSRITCTAGWHLPWEVGLVDMLVLLACLLSMPLLVRSIGVLGIIPGLVVAWRYSKMRIDAEWS